VINADNGPENSGVRTQWIKRLVELSATHDITVQLACYPPYHSKYNPVERVFGVLENYWNGDPLCSVAKALGMAEGMTYKGVHPSVTLVESAYAKGVRLNKKQMKPFEKSLQRLDDLGKWFFTITASVARRACGLPDP
jgi:hypothetical protein